ncbi:hypothetical protein AWW72_13250 [Acinetobacter sp. NRRL B-65365]|uniref:hypothetical protein n=1 Tax=Acinetobacter sp. NRRL B-65365 TaxID=1785092 RepID=UPI0007A01C98|nr:hypothetical protein [Acinetobacter sp. NRRL B-65365]KYQ83549.1 hypothetical protein AWW72_13250 [Acinetobacter sp. NRRL B-65365]
MNAIQFIKDHGVEKAKEVLNKYQDCYMPEVFKYWSEQMQDFVLAPKYASCLVSDLKHLVESVDLIDSYGGIRLLEYQVRCLGQEMSDALKQAIGDYESIYSGEEA